MNLTRTDILGIGVITGFVATISYAIKCSLELKAVSEKLDVSIKDLVDKKNIDISEKLIDEAVEEAVRKEAKYQVEKAASKAAGSVVNEFKTDIRNVVEDEFKNQKMDVAKSLKKKIDDIDIQELKREVIREAKESCANKLKKDLEDISDKYTEQIDSMTNIYSTIASKIESIGE